jgi:hypothetical protein
MVSLRTQFWTQQIIHGLGQDNATLLEESMEMVNKMRKGEILPRKFEGRSISSKDEGLLQSLQVALRRLLNAEGFWQLKWSISNEASESE